MIETVFSTDTTHVWFTDRRRLLFSSRKYSQSQRAVRNLSPQMTVSQTSVAPLRNF